LEGVSENGEGSANLLESSVLSVSTRYSVAWTKDKIDLSELASKRWVERKNMEQLAEHFKCGRTLIVRKLGQLKKNPGLVESGRVRSMIKSRKYRLMGGS
jgi:hypothetical protein